MTDDWSPLLTSPNLDESPSPIVETPDPSWKHNFKWVYNHENGETHVWPTRDGGIDGRPYHRTEFRKIWGRDPRVQDGDTLGLASYIPAERKLDGTIVAPPTVLLQTYYKMNTPQGVYNYFEQVFPDAVIRHAKLAANGDFAEWTPNLSPSFDEAVVKWVWNRQDGALIWQSNAQGLPTHEQKIEQAWHRPRNPNDFLGYAVPNGAILEMETYNPVSPIGLQTVKQKLAELYPDKDVTLPEHSESTIPPSSDPSVYARREAAIRWATETFGSPSEIPLEAHVSPVETTQRESGSPAPPLLVRGLRKVMGLPPASAATGPDFDGCMVAVFVPKEVGEKIKVKGGEPVEDLHITLAYFQDKAADRDDWDEVQRIVEQIAKQHPPLTGKIGGVGIFQNDESENVLWASPNIPGLAELRDDIVEAVEDAGFPLSKDHGWTPHVTLKYDFNGKPPHLPNLELELTDLSFAQGGDQRHFKFEGGFEKRAVDDYLDWSGWQGPYRFATDGKEIIKEPHTEDVLPMETASEFRRRYPDTKGLVQGIAYPTADEMGYGVYSPGFGWGGKDEPEIHKVIALLDRELGKPTHLMDHTQEINPKDYVVNINR